MDAEKALEGPAEEDAEAAQRVWEAYAAVQDFRAQHGLGEAAVEAAAEPEVAERAR